MSTYEPASPAPLTARISQARLLAEADDYDAALDELEKGVTPFRYLLRPGVYEVILDHPGHGKVSFTRRIEPGKPTKISYRF